MSLVTWDDYFSLQVKLKKRSLILLLRYFVNPLSANPIKWSNTLKQIVDNSPTNCLSVFNHFLGGA